jgi:hypothetical protein
MVMANRAQKACISKKSGRANGYWVVSENDNAATAAFHQPTPFYKTEYSSRRRLRPNVFVQKCGYRTRHSLVAVATHCSVGREDGRPLQEANAVSILGTALGWLSRPLTIPVRRWQRHSARPW